MNVTLMHDVQLTRSSNAACPVIPCPLLLQHAIKRMPCSNWAQLHARGPHAAACSASHKEQKKKELEELEKTFAELGISPAEQQAQAEEQQRVNEKRRRKKEKKDKGEDVSPARDGQPPEGQAAAQESTEEGGGTVDPAVVSVQCQPHLANALLGVCLGAC
eukprot:1136809-Pelagomonas_calceolata.AAC.3